MQLQELDLGYDKGRDRLMLRLPVVVCHIIDADSPLAPWRAGPAALGADADAEIYVAVSHAGQLLLLTHSRLALPVLTLTECMMATDLVAVVAA